MKKSIDSKLIGKLLFFLLLVGCVLIALYSTSASFVKKYTNTAIVKCTNDYYTNDFGIENNGEDCTAALQSLIDSVYSNGGGNIIFDKGTYAFTGVVLKCNVSLKGQGVGETVLRRLNGETIQDSFIYIPSYSVGITIENLALDGNKENDSVITAGIKVEGQTTWSAEGDKYDFAKNPYLVINEDIEKTYRYATFNKLNIFEFSGDGIQIGQVNYAVMVKNIISYCNNENGLYNMSSDNSFSNLILERNGKNGLYNAGGNCKYSNVRSIWNGYADHGAWGILNEASRSMFLNAEVQDNWCNGLAVIGRDNSFVNVIMDSNGYSYGGSMNPQDSTILYINGDRNRVIGTCSQRRKDLEPIALYPIVMEESYQCKIDVIVEKDCAINDSLINVS